MGRCAALQLPELVSKLAAAADAVQRIQRTVLLGT
jgi:hypothetical protein